MGVRKSEFAYKEQKLVSGRKATGKYEVTADESLKNKGYKLGDQVTLNGSSHKYKIVGFVQDAKINIEPIIYGSLANWKKLKNAMPTIAASGVISKRSRSVKGKNYKSYGIKQFIKKLPGYSAQNLTFELMIAFMFIISLMIVGVFLYILTIQKTPELRGFKSARDTGQDPGLGDDQPEPALDGGWLSDRALGHLGHGSCHAKFSANGLYRTIFASAIGGMLAMALIGGLIPVKTILKIDPVAAIGG